MIIPIYRPEITLYRRDEDGLWQSDRPSSSPSLFYPLPDKDEVDDSGRRTTVHLGSTPFCHIRVPDGSWLGHNRKHSIIARKDQPCFLFTEEDCYDTVNALVAAKRGHFGFSMARDDAIEPEPSRTQAPNQAGFQSSPFFVPVARQFKTWRDIPILDLECRPGIDYQIGKSACFAAGIRTAGEAFDAIESGRIAEVVSMTRLAARSIEAAILKARAEQGDPDPHTAPMAEAKPKGKPKQLSLFGEAG